LNMKADRRPIIQLRGGYIIKNNFDSELTVSRKNEDIVFSPDDSGSVIHLNSFCTHDSAVHSCEVYAAAPAAAGSVCRAA